MFFNPHPRIFFLFLFFSFSQREWKGGWEEGEREKNTSMWKKHINWLPPTLTLTRPGIECQSDTFPWLGITPRTLQCAGQCSNHWATLAKARTWCFLTFRKMVHRPGKWRMERRQRLKKKKKKIIHLSSFLQISIYPPSPSTWFLATHSIIKHQYREYEKFRKVHKLHLPFKSTGRSLVFLQFHFKSVYSCANIYDVVIWHVGEAFIHISKYYILNLDIYL